MFDKRHPLKKYVEILEKYELLVRHNTEKDTLKEEVRYVSCDSRDIRGGTLFICKGVHFTADYLRQALKKGAFTYISETEYEEEARGVPYIIVNDIRQAMALIAELFYNDAWKDLKMTGITGTKGKSTTTYFVRYILDEYLKAKDKPASAVISGISNYDGVSDEDPHLTTPEALDLHRHIYNATRSGIEFLTMEVSSQALKYKRCMGIRFDVGCFLNIGLDHISSIEHPNFEDYLESKLMLMKQCETACISLDSQYAQAAIEAARDSARRIVTFGETPAADISGHDVKPVKGGVSFKVRGDGFDEEFMIGMAGLFNVKNALAAIAICRAMDIPLEYIEAGLEKARVSGRMEVYSNSEGTINVIVDYAHNQMSFESLFASARKEYPGKKITIVFGCPGKKAYSRRKQLGDIAGRYADKVYITEEDAGEEPVIQISKEIESYVVKSDCECSIVVDRGEAIRQAIETADEDTVVLITGKGREKWQKRGLEYIDTPSDVEYVERFLAQ